MLNHVTLLLMFSCLKEQCLDNNICSEKYGQTAEFADCSIENCKGAPSRCMIQTINDIVTEMKKENPSASIESLRIQAGKNVANDVLDFWKCLMMFREKPIDSIMCMLDALLTLTHEDNNNKKSSDQAYIMCWINKFNNGVTGCFSQYDLQTLKTLSKYFNEQYQELSECPMKLLPQYSKMCIPASMRLFGKNTASQFSDSWEEYSDCVAALNDVFEFCKNLNFAHHDSFSPSITTYAKDIFICSINEMISATAAC